MLQDPLNHSRHIDPTTRIVKVFYASLMNGLTDIDVFEAANIPRLDELAERLWARTNWLDLLRACDGIDADDADQLDDGPGYSDILYKVTIFDGMTFS